MTDDLSQGIEEMDAAIVYAKKMSDRGCAILYALVVIVAALVVVALIWGWVR